MKPMTLVAVCTFAFAGVAVGLGGAVYAAEKVPRISKNLARPLKAAQDAIKAKKCDDAIADLKVAQAQQGRNTDYDNFVINEMLGISY